MAYNLVLVDDEDWILSGLQNAVEWEEIGFQVTGAFTNGKEALEFMLTNPPDAVLTDIKMPIQDGISLVRELRAAGFGELEVVFLSGYDDFSLAQSSLRLGAVDYVLKPSSPEQIYEVFHSIRKRLDERKRQKEEKQIIYRMAQAGIRAMRETIYNSILSNNTALYQRLIQLYKQVMEGERGRYFIVVSVALENTVKAGCPDREDVKALDIFRNLAKEQAAQMEERVYLLKNPYSFSFIMLDYTEDLAEEFLNELGRRTRKETGQRMIAAKSGRYQEIEKTWEAYEESMDRLLGLELPVEIRRLYINMENDTVLKAAVDDRDQQVMIWCLKNWILKIDHTEKMYHLSLLKRLMYGFGIFLLQSEISHSVIQPLFELFDEKENDEEKVYEKVKERMISFVKAELLAEKGENHRNYHLCRQVAKYISKNYMEEITLNDLAERFYISANYLGTLFKKNMGSSIKEYQTMIRLEQADVLIGSGKFKLYQVAEMVGYPNYEYFRKIYGKYRGRNPSKAEN